MNIKSRILEFIPKDCMIEIDAISRDVLIPDNNTKVNKISEALTKYNVPFQELGPGTNRFAVFIDGYVFKFALDKDGKRDNLAEFSMSQELQPFVIKVYECNGLIIVTEYVTVISREEFMNSKDQIRETLSYLSEGYLLGDVGCVTKNFVNWGYRDDGSLVILDFAYIYRILGNEMTCGGLNKDDTICKELLEYDENFNNLICPRCRKTYTFHDIRRKISKDYETRELNAIKQIAFKVTKPNQEINAKHKIVEEPEVVETINDNYGGNEDMSKKNKYYDDYDREEDINEYLAAMEFMKHEYEKEHHICECDCECNCEDVNEEIHEEVTTFSSESDSIEVNNVGYDNVESDDTDSLVDVIDDEDDDYDEELTQAEIDAIQSVSPIEKASENVDDYLEADDVNEDEDEDDDHMIDPEEENVREWVKEESVNILGAGVEFIDVNEKQSETPLKPKLEDAGTEVMVFTNSDEEKERLQKILMSDNDVNEDDEEDDYNDEYDEMLEQALRDSKIPKKNNLK